MLTDILLLLAVLAVNTLIIGSLIRYIAGEIEFRRYIKDITKHNEERLRQEEAELKAMKAPLAEVAAEKGINATYRVNKSPLTSVVKRNKGE